VKLTLVCIGKLSADWLQSGASDYAGRISHYLPLTIDELKEVKAGGKKPDRAQIRQREGDLLLQKISPSAFVVALDEQGKSVGSESLSHFIGKHMLDGTQEVTFLIGGAYGLSDQVKQRADMTLSLSAMTLTHQMARLLLLEQIYRAMTILRNEPYHNR
jgi:23S rRNA (pseudouridine1915-N3)-methyltransferase